MQRFCLLLLCLAFAACAGNHTASGTGEPSSWAPPPSGTIVAADSMKVDDKLNDFYFSVKLAPSPNNDKPGNNYGFIYDVYAHFGPNIAVPQINMPKGGKNLKPVLRRDESVEYGYIIGFIPPVEMGGDGKTFRPYYQIKAVKGLNVSIELKPLARYAFD